MELFTDYCRKQTKHLRNTRLKGDHLLDFSRKDYDYRVKGTSRKPLFLNRSLDRNLLDFEIVEEPGRDITDETHDLVKEVNKKMNKLQDSLESVGSFPESDQKA